jgi:hypothetical protein
MFVKLVQAWGVRVYTVRSQWVRLSSRTSLLGPLLSPKRWPISRLLAPRPSWCVPTLDPVTRMGATVRVLLRHYLYRGAACPVVGCREEEIRWLP